MLIFFDTEFTDLSMDAQLISIGLISEDGMEFYAEIFDAYELPNYSAFVLDAVLPHLNGGDSLVSMDTLTLRLGNWLEGFEQPLTMATDSITWDWPWILKLFSLPGTWSENLDKRPMSLYDLIGSPLFERTVDQVFRNAVPPLCRHHALDDAKANRFAWLECVKRSI